MDILKDITIEEGILKFTLDTTVEDLENCTFEVYVDDVDNLPCVLSKCGCHSLVFDQILHEGNKFQVSDERINEFDNNAKLVTLKITYREFDFETEFKGLFYDYRVIYFAEINALQKYCSTCLDDKMLQTIVKVVFKRQLLEDEIKSNNFVKALKTYADICRILNISVKPIETSEETECSVCKNGVCSICR